MANTYNPKQAAQQQSKQPQQATPKPTAPAPTTSLPTLAKVSQQHAIARTKADITAVQTIAAKRTEIVLQAFDNAMAESDADIIAALEQRLGGESDGFFGFDLEAEFAALLVAKGEPTSEQQPEPPAEQATIDVEAQAPAEASV